MLHTNTHGGTERRHFQWSNTYTVGQTKARGGGEKVRNAYGGGGVCVVAPTLGFRQACKGEGAPSLASSLPFRKWAGCTREGEKKQKQVSTFMWL